MSEQKLLFNDTPYKKEHTAKIIGKSTELGIKVDELIFYPTLLGGCSDTTAPSRSYST